MLGKPKKGKGKRNLKCEYYKDCLNFTAKEEWDCFNCEGCPRYNPNLKEISTSPEKKENKNICKDCGEKPTITPTSPYCPTCLSKKAKKTKISDPQGGLKAKELQKSKNTVLTIEFGRHSQILRQIEKLSEEEMRPVDMQVIYILKNYLENNGAIKSP